MVVRGAASRHFDAHSCGHPARRKRPLVHRGLISGPVRSGPFAYDLDGERPGCLAGVKAAVGERDFDACFVEALLDRRKQSVAHGDEVRLRDSDTKPELERRIPETLEQDERLRFVRDPGYAVGDLAQELHHAVDVLLVGHPDVDIHAADGEGGYSCDGIFDHGFVRDTDQRVVERA